MRAARIAAIAVLVLAELAIAGCRPSSGGTAECTPGRPVLVACGCDGLGACTERPDPVLRVCDGADDEAACTWDTLLGENDDAEGCGHCPAVRVVCPESGTLLVIPRSHYPDEIVRCDWELREED